MKNIQSIKEWENDLKFVLLVFSKNSIEYIQYDIYKYYQKVIF
jgi:hypothetical protein